ncbi:MAG: hypothetical protein IPH05_11025 [Flavobacteriales bacterium]|nr:hypothetical protein [Flavobacteriales bacterium]
MFLPVEVSLEQTGEQEGSIGGADRSRGGSACISTLHDGDKMQREISCARRNAFDAIRIEPRRVSGWIKNTAMGHAIGVGPRSEQVRHAANSIDQNHKACS